jgi:4-amino-4-deoxy-L-arabinose transferase-like glycosyltransferase
LGLALAAGKIHFWTNWDTDKLVVFSVVTLFLIGNGAVVACLKRPEAWLAAFILVSQPQVSDLTQRYLLGRPFVLTVTATLVIFLVWQRHGSRRPNGRRSFG